VPLSVTVSSLALAALPPADGAYPSASASASPLPLANGGGVDSLGAGASAIGSQGSELGPGAVAGIVLAVIAGLTLGGALWRRRKAGAPLAAAAPAGNAPLPTEANPMYPSTLIPVSSGAAAAAGSSELRRRNKPPTPTHSTGGV
jgi:hypothetical protein